MTGSAWGQDGKGLEFNIMESTGLRMMQDDSWDNVAAQEQFGLQMDIRPGWAPFALLIGGNFSAATNTTGRYDQLGTVVDLYVGGRKYIGSSRRARLFVSGGLARLAGIMDVTYNGDTTRYEENQWGGFLEAGAQLRPGYFRLGILGRGMISQTKDDSMYDMDHWSIMIVIGFGKAG
ncbi:MAG: hypothetical protein OEY50_08040 [Nitrospinota bacterium]|nr:hypothetical protein [Nitrospinota bacterium]MDH5678509.1 hypothetical protein [Nitrospinota bacterium]